jgi:hypothetical protein
MPYFHQKKGGAPLQGFDGGVWVYQRSHWQRIGQQTKDYWNDACRHLKARNRQRGQDLGLIWLTS